MVTGISLVYLLLFSNVKKVLSTDLFTDACKPSITQHHQVTVMYRTRVASELILHNFCCVFLKRFAWQTLVGAPTQIP